MALCLAAVDLHIAPPITQAITVASIFSAKLTILVVENTIVYLNMFGEFTRIIQYKSNIQINMNVNSRHGSGFSWKN